MRFVALAKAHLSNHREGDTALMRYLSQDNKSFISGEIKNVGVFLTLLIKVSFFLLDQ